MPTSSRFRVAAALAIALVPFWARPGRSEQAPESPVLSPKDAPQDIPLEPRRVTAQDIRSAGIEEIFRPVVTKDEFAGLTRRLHLDEEQLARAHELYRT